MHTNRLPTATVQRKLAAIEGLCPPSMHCRPRGNLPEEYFGMDTRERPR